MKSLVVVLLCGFCWPACVGLAADPPAEPETEVTTFLRTKAESVAQLSKRQDLADCEYVEYGAAWKVVFRVEAVCDKDGWKDVSDQKLIVAVRDAAGQFNVYSDQPNTRRVFLLVERDKKTGAIRAVYKAPPDMVRATNAKETAIWPNQAPLPIRSSVTPRACARGAPAALLAGL